MNEPGLMNTSSIPREFFSFEGLCSAVGDSAAPASSAFGLVVSVFDFPCVATGPHPKRARQDKIRTITSVLIASPLASQKGTRAKPPEAGGMEKAKRTTGRKLQASSETEAVDPVVRRIAANRDAQWQLIVCHLFASIACPAAGVNWRQAP